MKDLFHQYGWIYEAILLASAAGCTIIEDDFFLTLMLILGFPIAVWAIWMLGCQSLKFVFDRSFSERMD